MNRAKSLFVTFYISVACCVVLVAAVRLMQEGFHWGWAGAGLAAGAAAAFFGFVFAASVARTSRNLWWVTGFVALGAAVAWAGLLQGESPWPGLLSLGVLAGWLAYVFWYSRFPGRESEVLRVGRKVPAFELEDAVGEAVASDSLLGRPAVLIFYRGNWCPLCSTQVRELAERYQEIEALGARVALISPQPPGHTRKLAARFDVPFLFWVDAGTRVAQQLGIAARGGTPVGMEVFGYASDTVMPTAVVIDAEGTILFADLTDNYRVRPEPETFLRVLRAVVT